MKAADIEALYQLLGSWEKTRESLLTSAQEQRLRHVSYGHQWSDSLIPYVLELITSPVEGKPFKRRLGKLIEQQEELDKRDRAMFAKAFMAHLAHPPVERESETMSTRTLRRLRRRGDVDK